MPDHVPAVPPPEDRSGRDRLLRALTRPSRGQVVVGALLAVLGFSAVVQLQSNARDDNFVGARQADLIALINTLSTATDRAEADIVQLQRTRDALLDDAERTGIALELARQRAETLGILAGTVPATGPGIRLTVEPRAGSVGSDQLLNGIQELRNAGAEAIEVADRVRVVASTGLQDGPNGLLVGGEPVSAPYVIEAIGDPDTLASAMRFDEGFVDTVEQVGGRVRIEQLDEIEIAAVAEVPQTRFAEPAEQG